MADASPRCERCKGPMVFIGISGAAAPACPKDCAPVAPHEKCPKCGSLDTEPYAEWAYGFPGIVIHPSRKAMHCWPCGAVWED